LDLTEWGTNAAFIDGIRKKYSVTNCRILKANLSWSLTRAKLCHFYNFIRGPKLI